MELTEKLLGSLQQNTVLFKPRTYPARFVPYAQAFVARYALDPDGPVFDDGWYYLPRETAKEVANVVDGYWERLMEIAHPEYTPREN